jgi:hypothetical protein
LFNQKPVSMNGAGSPIVKQKEIDDYVRKVTKKIMKMDLLASKKKPEPKPCRYCLEHPCVMTWHYEELMEIGREMEPYHSNKEIRYALYRQMATWLWGPLGKNKRREFPKCVSGEIRDAYPKKKEEAYVGFQPFGSMEAVSMVGESLVRLEGDDSD